jgi:hypothetical protein
MTEEECMKMIALLLAFAVFGVTQVIRPEPINRDPANVEQKK